MKLSFINPYLLRQAQHDKVFVFAINCIYFQKLTVSLSLSKAASMKLSFINPYLLRQAQHDKAFRFCLKFNYPIQNVMSA